MEINFLNILTLLICSVFGVKSENISPVTKYPDPRIVILGGTGVGKHWCYFLMLILWDLPGTRDGGYPSFTPSYSLDSSEQDIEDCPLSSATAQHMTKVWSFWSFLLELKEDVIFQETLFLSMKTYQEVFYQKQFWHLQLISSTSKFYHQFSL